jgi:Fe-S cluster assembly protein SufB
MSGSIVSYDEVLKDLKESDIVEFSRIRKEPKWILERRLEAYRFLKSSRPDPKVDSILEKLAYRIIIEGYLSPLIDLDEALEYAEKIGMPKEEIKLIAEGLSVTVDNRLIKALLRFLKSKGIIFTSTDEAVSKYDIVKDYMFRLIKPTSDRKSAYHVMLWSGGPFLYIPKGVRIPQPFYSLFILGREGLTQTEHTLIISDEGSSLSWIEGCVTPFKVNVGVHLGALEGFVLDRARLTVVSINNWTGNVYHMPIKRLLVSARGKGELSVVSLWSKVVNIAPTIYVVGNEGNGVIQNVGFYREDQEIYSAPKVYLLAKSTSSIILNRTVVGDRAQEEFRGTIVAKRGSKRSTGYMSCNTLLLSSEAKSVAVPALETEEKDVDLSHEASVGRVDYEKLFYLGLSGFDEEEAIWMLVSGFFDPILSKLPGSIKEEVTRVIALALQAH